MATHDWSRFSLRIPVNAAIENLYRYWATREGLESWFLRKAAFTMPAENPRPANELVKRNDVYEWRWHGWPDDVVEHGTILESNGKDYLKFSFGKAGNVAVTIREDQGENIVELVQDEIPTDERSITLYHLGCTKGWLFYLSNLKSIAEGGIDLRNRNEALKDVVNS